MGVPALPSGEKVVHMGKYTAAVFVRTEVSRRSDAYQFRPWRRFRWLERRVQKVWLALAESFPQTKVLHTKRTIHHDSILDLLNSQRRSIYEAWDRRCRHLVVGPDHLRDLKDDPKCTQPPYVMSIPLGGTSLAREYSILGITVHIVPWCNEPILLPDWEDL